MNVKKETQAEARPDTTDNFLSFDEVDNFFDDLAVCMWPRFLDWNIPVGFEKGFSKVDFINHDKEIEAYTALTECNKHDVEA